MTQILFASELDENAQKVSWKKFKALVAKYGGWFELEIVRFHHIGTANNLKKRLAHNDP